jgi:CBS domain-containing protein
MYEFLDYRVEDVMSRPTSVGPCATLDSVEAIIEKYGFNALPVVDAAERVIGLVTSLDVLRAFTFPEDTILPPFEEIMKTRVEQVMTRDVMTVCPRTPLTRVLEKIRDTRNKSFPVVDGDRLVGVVAREDVLRALRQADRGIGPQGSPESPPSARIESEASTRS